MSFNKLFDGSRNVWANMRLENLKIDNNLEYDGLALPDNLTVDELEVNNELKTGQGSTVEFASGFTSGGATTINADFEVAGVTTLGGLGAAQKQAGDNINFGLPDDSSTGNFTVNMASTFSKAMTINSTLEVGGVITGNLNGQVTADLDSLTFPSNSNSYSVTKLEAGSGPINVTFRKIGNMKILTFKFGNPNPVKKVSTAGTVEFEPNGGFAGSDFAGTGRYSFVVSGDTGLYDGVFNSTTGRIDLTKIAKKSDASNNNLISVPFEVGDEIQIADPITLVYF